VQLAHFEGAARGRLDDGVADKKASQILQAEGDTPALHACCPTTPGGLILQRCGRNSDDDADAKTTRICCAGESCRHFASLEVEVAFPHALVTNTLMKMRCKSVVTKGGGRLLRTIGEVQHHTVIIIRSVVSARIAACNCTRLTWRLGRSTTSTAPHPWAGWGGVGRDRDARWTVTTTGPIRTAKCKEQGARSKEQGARSKEQGARSKEQGARSKEQGARSKRALG
jgi:hypothetical protein